MNRHDLTKCFIEDGVLTICIGVELIAHAAKLHPDLSEYDAGAESASQEWVEPEITDADQFAAAVLAELKSEEEDGTTLIHRAMDGAIINAIENGAEGIKTADDIIRERRKPKAVA